MQWRVTYPSLITSVYLCTTRQQCCDDLFVARERGEMERRKAAPRRALRGSSRIEKCRHDPRATVENGDIEWGVSLDIGNLRARATSEQPLDYGRAPTQHRPVQGSVALSVASIDIDVRPLQLRNCAPFGGFG